MALPITFANLPGPIPLAYLDQQFAAVEADILSKNSVVAPTGTTSDSAALSAAMAALGQGTIYLTPGTFQLTTQLVIPVGITLIGAGYSDGVGVGSSFRGATCLLRNFTGSLSTVLVSGDNAGIDFLDVDSNLQGTGDGVAVWGSRSYLGVCSSRNAGGWGWRVGQTAVGVSTINANVFYGRRLIGFGNLLGGMRVDDTNTSTSLSYPLGAANANAGYVGSIDMSNNGVAYNITAITQAASAVVTINSPAAANPFTVRDSPGFALIGGMTQMNGQIGIYVTATGGVSGAWTVTLGINSTGFGAYTSGGTIGIGDGLQLGNCNGNTFGQVHTETNAGCGIHLKTDGTNAGPRVNAILSNDSEQNIGADILCDAASLPAAAPGMYNKVFNNVFVQVASRIVDFSTGNWIQQWNPGLTAGKRAYHQGETLNLVNAASSGVVDLEMYADTGLRNVARLYAQQSGSSGLLGLQTFGAALADRFVIDRDQQAWFTGLTNGVLFNKTVANTTTPGVNVEGSGARIDQVNSGTGASTVQAFYNGNGQVGSISTSGTATSFTTSSDYRLKENAQLLDGASALAAVMAWPVKSFTWRSSGLADVGFIAHELQAVEPSAVVGEKDAMDERFPEQIAAQGVDASKLIAKLAAAVQYLAGEVARLKG